MSRVRRFPLAAAAVLVALGVGSQVARYAGWRLNLTASAPLGFYHVHAPTSATIARGALVELCPPAWVTPAAYPFYMRGDCPGGGRAMLKTIVGVPDDHVSARDEGVEINEVLLPDSTPKGRSVSHAEIFLPVVRGAFVLRPGEYWVYGAGSQAEDAALSFDSRYFGRITTVQIRGVVSR